MSFLKKPASENLSDGDLYFASSFLFRQVDRLASNAFKSTGLSPSLARLLLQLLNQNYPFPSVLANDLWLSRSTISRLVQKLEKKGLVQNIHYENLAQVLPTKKAWELEPLLTACERHFHQQCRHIRGEEQCDILTKILTGAADSLAQ